MKQLKRHHFCCSKFIVFCIKLHTIFISIFQTNEKFGQFFPVIYRRIIKYLNYLLFWSVLHYTQRTIGHNNI